MRIILLIISLLFLGTGSAFAQHGHELESGSASKLELNHGKKWQTDAALRKGMTSMRAATMAALDALHAGKASDATFEAAARVMNAQVSYLIENCKLDPKADAQLHMIVSDILAASEILKGKSATIARVDGLLAAASALNRYGQFFAHPGWRAIPLGH